MQTGTRQVLNEKGSVLVFAVVLAAVMAIMGASYLALVEGSNRGLAQEIEMKRMYWANESFLNLGCRAITLGAGPATNLATPAINGHAGTLTYAANGANMDMQAQIQHAAGQTAQLFGGSFHYNDNLTNVQHVHEVFPSGGNPGTPPSVSYASWGTAFLRP